MNNKEMITELELSLDYAKKLVARGEALQRVHANRDFKEIVLEGYFKEEAIRLVMLKGDPSMQDQTSQLSIIKQIDAISAFVQYMRVVEHTANMASKALADGQETMAELMAEEV